MLHHSKNLQTVFATVKIKIGHTKIKVINKKHNQFQHSRLKQTLTIYSNQTELLSSKQSREQEEQ